MFDKAHLTRTADALVAAYPWEHQRMKGAKEWGKATVFTCVDDNATRTHVRVPDAI